jgi:glycogen debranching enzyme
MDETSRQQMIPHYRNVFFSLAEYLKTTGDKDRLKQLMEKYHEVFPAMERNVSSTPYSMYAFSANPIVEYYFYAGLTEYADSFVQQLTDEYNKEIKYYERLQQKFRTNVFIERHLYYARSGLDDLSRILKRYNQNNQDN